MQRQLHGIINDLKSAQEEMHAMTRLLPDAQWSVRASPDRWSVNENIEHLNLFSEMFLPALRSALDEARALAGTASGTRRSAGAATRNRRGLLGSLVYWMVGPSTRMVTTKAIPAAVPGAAHGAREVRARFDGFQKELVALTAAADGLPIDKVFITSPVDARIRYNLFTALGIIGRHQHRHLRQAGESLPQMASRQ